MKKDIHPEYKEMKVTCTCGAEFSILSTSEELSIDVCSQCHPFFTGKQRFLDSAGRVDKFQKRFADWDAKKIVEEHHGQILVSSEPSSGTTFTIHLPIQRKSDTLPGHSV